MAHEGLLLCVIAVILVLLYPPVGASFDNPSEGIAGNACSFSGPHNVSFFWSASSSSYMSLSLTKARLVG